LSIAPLSGESGQVSLKTAASVIGIEIRDGRKWPEDSARIGLLLWHRRMTLERKLRPAIDHFALAKWRSEISVQR
jgi:hypothetical protein